MPPYTKCTGGNGVRSGQHADEMTLTLTLGPPSTSNLEETAEKHRTKLGEQYNNQRVVQGRGKGTGTIPDLDLAVLARVFAGVKPTPVWFALYICLLLA